MFLTYSTTMLFLAMTLLNKWNSNDDGNYSNENDED